MLNLRSIDATSFADSHVVSRSSSVEISWKQFMDDVSMNRTAIRGGSNPCWALFEEDVYRFSVGLFALLAEHCTVVLPGDNNAKVVASLERMDAGFVGQFPGKDALEVGSADTCMARFADVFDLGGQLIIFTSGSTGEAKQIPKSLRQLDAELETLEQLWGKELGSAHLMGTVSQQHLYGLLFLVLWPICSGRTFWRQRFESPASLAHATSSLSGVGWVMSPAHLNRLSSDFSWAEIRQVVKVLFSSGGPLMDHAVREIRKGLGQPPTEVLGSSETGGVAWRRQYDGGRQWTPFPAVRVGQSGENALKVRSPFLPDDEWFIGEDEVRLLPGGRFLLGNRLDRIIKIEGKRVSLPEVETVISHHPWVMENAAVAVQRKRQAVAVAVVLNGEGQKCLEEMGQHRFIRLLRSHCRDSLIVAAVPKYWRFIRTLPRNAQGKVAQHDIQAFFTDDRYPPVLKQERTESGCRFTLLVKPDCVYFQGHFPGFAVLPGVVQLHWAEHFARRLLPIRGQFREMRVIKFMELVRPETELYLSVDYSREKGRLDFSFESVSGRHSQGQLYFGTEQCTDTP